MINSYFNLSNIVIYQILMAKEIILILITTFTLIANAHAGSDGELVLKNEPSKSKIVLKLSTKRLLLLIKV